MSLTWYTIKTLTFRVKCTYLLLSVAALQSKTDTNRFYDERFLQIYTLYLYSYLYWYIIAFACSIKRFVIVCLFFFSFSFSSVLLQRLPRVFLGTFYHSLTSKCVTKIGLISLFTLRTQELFLKLLFEVRVAHDIPCASQKIIMAEVGGHIQ